MISSQCNPHRACRGFTMTEVLIAASLGSIVLAGVLATFLMLVRSGVRLENYSAMETQTRRAFEQMGMDSRMASKFEAKGFVSGKPTAFTLTIPSNDLSTLTRVTYGFDGPQGNHSFYMVPGVDPAATTGRVNLITNIRRMEILRYDKDYTPITTTTSSGIKHVQISVSVERSGIGVAAATQVIRSSAFTIRNISL